MKTFLKRASSWVVSAAISLQIFAGTGVLDVTAFAASGTVIGPYTITGGMRNIDYKLESNILHIMSDIPITIANTNIGAASTVPIVVDANVDADITLAGVNIAPTNNAAIDVSPATQSKANVVITIADDTVNTLKGADDYAALQKNGEYISENEGKLTIQGEADGTGELNATGGSGGAGIGSWQSSLNGGDSITANVVIKGGNISAKGGSGAAGIGSGRAIVRGKGSKSEATYIIFDGGTITATGGSNAAGIGSGYGDHGDFGDDGDYSCNGGDGGDGSESVASHITINDGIITAYGGTNSAAIGSGNGGDGGDGGDGGGGRDSGGNAGNGGESVASHITINDGIITAYGGTNSAAIGSGHGGHGGNGGHGTYGGDGGDGGESVASHITINDGIITAYGGTNSAAIGSGNGGDGGDGDNGVDRFYTGIAGNGGNSVVSDFLISDGAIVATGGVGCGGAGAAGAGSSFSPGKAGLVQFSIEIKGGTITTTGVSGSAGVGVPAGGSISDIKIENCSLKSLGSANRSYYGANIGTGATSTTDGIPYLPTDADGNSLYLAEIENPTGGPIVIDGEDYPVTKHFDEAKIYAYLTDAYHIVTVGEQSYALNPRTGRLLPLPEVTAPTAVEGLVYNESDQILIEAGSTSNGTMMYALDKAGPYSEQLPTGLNANT